MKVVINKCYGGFSLSREAVLKYAKLKGITLYTHTFDTLTLDFIVPYKEYLEIYEKDKEKENYSESFKLVFSVDSIPRHDPILVQVVEELGKKSNGDCAELTVIEIPDEVDYEIEEYDGMEWISEKHRRWY